MPLPILIVGIILIGIGATIGWFLTALGETLEAMDEFNRAIWDY